MKRPPRKLKFSFLLLMIGGLFYFFLFSPVFEIRRWHLEQEDFFKKETFLKTVNHLAEQRVWGIFPQKNFFILLLTSSSFKRTLYDLFPEIKNIAMIPSWQKESVFKSFKLRIEQREKVGIWCNAKKTSSEEENSNKLLKESCYYFDDQGFLFKQAPQTKGPFLFVVKNETDLSPGSKQEIEDKKLLNALLYLKQAFSQIPFSVEEIRVFSLNHDLEVKTNEGWSLYFDPQTDIERAFQVFLEILPEKLEPTKTLEYVDLRIKNRAYVKRK